MANWRGTWNAGTLYAVNDSVGYAGTVWVAAATSAGQVPTPGTYWTAQDVLDGPGSVIDNVTVTGTPSSGQVITATSATAAHWATPAPGVALDSTAGDIAALGSQAAGSTGKAADAGHVHPDLNLYAAPSGATAETCPRRYASTSSSAQNTGTLYATAIAMASGILVSNITMASGTAAKTGGTHGWYVLLDSGLVVRAVTADQTDAATVWGVAQTAYTLATNSYTTTYTGLYYIGVMVAATGMPTFLAATATGNAVNGVAPVLAGSSSTSQTTPPSTGTTMTSLSGASRQFYAYTS
jgi:hypothetical protein